MVPFSRFFVQGSLMKSQPRKGYPYNTSSNSNMATGYKVSKPGRVVSVGFGLEAFGW